MSRFEKISKYAEDDSFHLPQRKTSKSAGYDFEVAKDIVIPSYPQYIIKNKIPFVDASFIVGTLSEVADYTKKNFRPTLVPTGVKCYLEDNQYLELSVRSSCPLKHLLILANGVGIIDADYADNPDNEGEIFFQILNLSPFDIKLKKGDIIGQGIIKSYSIIENDNASGARLGGFGSTG